MIRRHHDDARAFEEAWSGRAPRDAAAVPGSGRPIDAEIASLVNTAEQLCAAAAVEPSAEFRGGLRDRLMTEAASVLVTSPEPVRAATKPAVSVPRPGRRRLAGATAALIGAVSVVSLIGSSASALPGDVLYPVKRTVENVELAMHTSDVSKAQFRLTLASERLAEARQLAEKGSPSDQRHISDALDEFTDQAEDGSTTLFDDFDSSRSTDSITVVNDFTAAAATDLAALSNQLPKGAGDAFDAATATVSKLAVQAADLCSTCGTADVSGIVTAVSSLGTPEVTDPPRTDPTPQAQAAAPTVVEKPVETTTTAPSPKPTVSLPSIPEATQDPVGTLGKITKPIVGALLGDDEQEGLIPGLLNTLLGKK
jgi:hypothetical protein